MNCTTKESNPQVSDSENRLAHEPQLEGTNTIPAASLTKARVQSKLQSEILEQAALTFGQDEGELFVLMSQSSWADQGQIWLTIKNKGHNDTNGADPNEITMQFLAPAQKDLGKAQTRPLSPDEIKSLWPELLAASQLSDYDPQIFDGMQYEFVQVRFELGKPLVIHRLFMNNPEPQKALQHYRLIELMRGLLPQ